MNKAIFFSFVTLLLSLSIISCSGSTDNESGDIYIKDVDSIYKDSELTQDAHQDILYSDEYTGDTLLIDSSDISDSLDISLDASDVVSEIFEDGLIYDIEETEGNMDTLYDASYQDSEDIVENDSILLSDISDVDDITDTSETISPPVLKLLTPSPSNETRVKIGGEVIAGETISLFDNKYCSSKPIKSLSVSDFLSSGFDIDIMPQSTNYFSAYVILGDQVSRCSNFVTYVHHNNSFWRVTFFDDFKGPQGGEDPECYSMPPQCIGEYLSGLYECPQSEVHSGLSSLNKCNWTILRQPNWMAKEYGADRNGTNGFTPLEVSVDPHQDNGVLILSANAYRWDQTKLNPSALTTAEKICLQQSQSNWLLHENNLPDCRNVIKYDCVWNRNTNNCPIMSGAVYSKHFDIYKAGNSDVKKDRGFIQEYGRWEVRAKLPEGQGSFPAHWLLPQSGSWPERGEIDIMEADRTAEEVYQTYHTGYCEGSPEPYYADHRDCIANNGQRYHLASSGRLRMKSGSFSQSYHLYAVEWSKDRIEFSIDYIPVITVNRGQLIYGTFTDYYRTTGQARPLNIPYGDFFIILNQTVHNDRYGEISPLSFVTQMHIIDFVKVYNVCAEPSDFCRDGYYFDGNDELCHPVENSGLMKSYPSPCKQKTSLIPASVPIDTNTYYACTNPCPFGEWFDGSNCKIFDAPSKREVFFYPDQQGNLYYVTDGSQNGNCFDVINGITIPVGKFDGANCYLDKTLPDLYGKYFRYGSPKPSSFYYSPFCRFE